MDFLLFFTALKLDAIKIATPVKNDGKKTPYSKTTFNLALHLVWGIAQNMIQTDEEQDSILLSWKILQYDTYPRIKRLALSIIKRKDNTTKTTLLN